MKKNNKGFTLAELLIVIAIIGVLIAIAMPTFRGQLTNAEKATVEANARATYAEAVVKYLDDGTTGTTGHSYVNTIKGATYTATQDASSDDKWQVVVSGSKADGTYNFGIGTTSGS